MVRLDSSLDAKANPKLVKFVDKKKSKLDKNMNVVIGRTDMAMVNFKPASPLSNFLTDLLLENGPQKVEPAAVCDFAMLNFGGIRAQLPEGNVTVGNIYALSPFDNYLVLIDVKGSELRKALMKFTDKFSAPMAGIKMVYRNGRPVKILIGGEPLSDTKTYRMITLNFIAEGGDNLLRDVHYERVVNSNVIFRDFLLEEIQKMTREGKVIHCELDDRVVIEPVF